MPENKHTLSFAFLFSLGIMFSTLAYFFNQYSLHVLESDPLLLTIYNETHPLKLGVISLTTLFFANSHLLFIILTDLYPSPKMWSLPFFSALSLFISSSLFFIVPELPYLEGSITLNTVLHSIINFSLETSLNIVFALFTFHFLSMAGFQMMRKLLRGHLVLPQYIMASLLAAVGFGLIYGKQIALSPSQWAVASLTHGFQFFFLCILFVPVFYIVRLPFRLLTGSHYQTIKKSYRKKSLFKPDQDFVESHAKKQEDRLKPVETLKAS